MVTVHTSLGYGIKVTPSQQAELEEILLKKFCSTDLTSDVRNNTWFTLNKDDLFLYDALEEYYEEVFKLTSQADDCIIITTISSTVTDSHDPNFSTGFQKLPSKGNRNELKHLNELCILLNVEPQWVLSVSTFL